MNGRTTAVVDRGFQVLVAEDEYYLAMEIAQELEGIGADVIGPACTVEMTARLLASFEVDLAVLDINLRNEMIYGIARDLMARGIPIVIATGYDSTAMPEEFRNVPRLEKPVNPGDVAALARAVLTLKHMPDEALQERRPSSGARPDRSAPGPSQT